jgi:hypothetical protein
MEREEKQGTGHVKHALLNFLFHPTTPCSPELTTTMFKGIIPSTRRQNSSQFEIIEKENLPDDLSVPASAVARNALKERNGQIHRAMPPPAHVPKERDTLDSAFETLLVGHSSVDRGLPLCCSGRTSNTFVVETQAAGHGPNSQVCHAQVIPPD